MRIFTAIELSEEIKAELCRCTACALQHAVHGRPTPPERMHLTLAFLGEIPSEKPVITAMEKAAGSAFSLSLDKTGRFRRQGGDLLFAAVKADNELFDLQKRLMTCLKEAGLSPDEKPFRPHITLARELVCKPLADGLFPHTMQVNHITCFSSVRKNGKLIYEKLADVPLFSKKE